MNITQLGNIKNAEIINQEQGNYEVQILKSYTSLVMATTNIKDSKNSVIYLDDSFKTLTTQKHMTAFVEECLRIDPQEWKKIKSKLLSNGSFIYKNVDYKNKPFQYTFLIRKGIESQTKMTVEEIELMLQLENF